MLHDQLRIVNDISREYERANQSQQSLCSITTKEQLTKKKYNFTIKT